MRRWVYLIMAIISGLGLPLSVLALLTAFNPYAMNLSANFEIHNRSEETVFVTPVGASLYASGELKWHVLPQLALPILTIPARQQTDFRVGSGASVSIRANFDDISLAGIAINTEDGKSKMLVVDPNAACGGCCYPPRERTVVLQDVRSLPGLDEGIAEVVEQTARYGPNRFWAVLVLLGAGALSPFGLWYFIRRFRRYFDEIDQRSDEQA